MTQKELFEIMGPADEIIPFVEGKSLEHRRGFTAYEWANPASMPGPNHISVNDQSQKVTSIRCSNVSLMTPVVEDRPVLSTTTSNTRR